MRWAISFPASSLSFAAALRDADVNAAACDQLIWLSGSDSDETLELIRRSIPGAVRYRVTQDNALIRTGTHVPCGWLPTVEWCSFAEWMTLRFPISGLPGDAARRVPIRLERCDPGDRSASMLLVDKASCLNFVTEAAMIRLHPLQFAVSSDDRVLLRGKPLPSIPGDRYWTQGRVAAPVGFSWQPAVSEDVVRQAMKAVDNETLVLNADGSCDRIEDESFIQVSRAAVRASCGG